MKIAKSTNINFLHFANCTCSFSKIFKFNNAKMKTGCKKSPIGGLQTK